jgi:hypothetical protein
MNYRPGWMFKPSAARYCGGGKWRGPWLATALRPGVTRPFFAIASGQCGPQISDERPFGQMQQRVQMSVRPIRLRVDNANGRK